MAGITRMAQASGVTFAMMDYAGHGTHPVSLDSSTKKQQFDECLAAYDELVSRGYKNIIVIGGSFGGYMAALVAGARAPAAVVLRAPAAYVDDEFELPYLRTAQKLPDGGHKYSFEKSPELHLQSSSFQAVARYDGPMYILEHEKDEVIPPIIPHTYFAKTKQGNYLLVPSTEHSPKTMPNPGKHFAYIEHLLVSIIRAVQLSP
jgi:esterase/lipase